MITTLFEHHPALAIVLTIAVVLMTGVAAQVAARRAGLPAILFLLGAGLVLGPGGLGVVDPAIFGEGGRAIVALAVAIIVFEGGLSIDVNHLRHASRSVLMLITVGAGVTFALAGFAAWALLGLPPKIAALYGAIVSVTGPTVIGPILRRLPLPHRLKTILEAESVLVDAVGVLLTASVFSYITGSADGVAAGLAQLVSHLAIGAAIGAVAAFGLKLGLARAATMPPELVRLTVLATALLTYGVAEACAHESGIAAVALAGLIAGSLRLPHEETVKQFKGDLTLIALSLVFVLLAAGMDLGALVALGWQGVAVVALVMAVIRPLAVALSTWGTRLTLRERAFIAWMGPRGIVAASMASLMAIELAAWDIQGGERVAPLVLLTVILTVSIEGGLAGWVANRLNIMPKKVLIVGGDEIARNLARRLADEGEAVTLLDSDVDNVREAQAMGLHALHGDAIEAGMLERAGMGWCQALVAASPSDKANLLICQTAKGYGAGPRLIARVNDTRNAGAFAESGIETLTVADATVTTLAGMVVRPTTLPLLGLGGGRHPETIVEVQIGNDQFAGRALRDLDLPTDCLVALVKRRGQVTVPDGKTKLDLGDTLTLIGEREAVEQLRTKLESDV